MAAVVEYDPSMAILGLPGSELLAAADRAGLQPVAEAFADRAYLPDGGLVARREPGSVLTDPTEIAERSVRLVTDGTVTAVDGSTVHVGAASLCVHGDTPGAVAIARAIRAALDAAGIDVAASPAGFVIDAGAAGRTHGLVRRRRRRPDRLGRRAALPAGRRDHRDRPGRTHGRRRVRARPPRRHRLGGRPDRWVARGGRVTRPSVDRGRLRRRRPG